VVRVPVGDPSRVAGHPAYGADPLEIPERAEQVLEVVERIPGGKVLTYGDVAQMVGSRGARFVGNVMSRYGSDVPWWRVLRSGGWPPKGLEERALEHYREEGTPLVRGVLDGLRVDLARARWEPEQSTQTPEEVSSAVAADTGAAPRGTLHHVEVWVTDLLAADAEWGWLLAELGYRRSDTWQTGRSWELGATYLVLEAGPDVAGEHDRIRAGVNHVAFHAGSRTDVDRLVAVAAGHGWTLMFADRHPYAGGPAHYAAYLENRSGFEVELVAAR
jgi:alkylated DNA nucleotide flippase Atl1